METQTFDLSAVANRVNRLLWFRRVLGLAWGGITGYAIFADWGLLRTAWVVQEGVSIGSLATAIFLVEGFLISRSPPTSVDVDTRGPTYRFASGPPEHYAFPFQKGTLVFRDLRGSRVALTNPGRVQYFVDALLPPLGMRHYPLTPEAFTAILEAVKAAGLQTDPPDWGPIVPGRLTVTLRSAPKSPR